MSLEIDIPGFHSFIILISFFNYFCILLIFLINVFVELSSVIIK